MRKLLWIFFSFFIFLALLFAVMSYSHTSLFGKILFDKSEEKFSDEKFWNLVGRVEISDGKIVFANLTG